MTVSRKFVHDADLMFDCMATVASADITATMCFSDYNEDMEQLKTLSPLWFSPYNYHTLAEWVCFYLVRALWVSFSRSVHGMFKS